MCARGRVLSDPRLSPDGASIAFSATSCGRSSLVVVASAGGPEIVVTTDPPPAAAGPDGAGVFDWMPSGEALVYAGADGRLYHQPVAGGPPATIVEHGPVMAPAVAPDGTRVAYVRDGRDVAVASLVPGGPWPVRISGGRGDREPGAGPGPGAEAGRAIGPGRPDFAFDPAWRPDGAVVAWQEWDVPAMPWDDSRIVVAPADGSGAALPLATSGPVAVGQPRFSPDGALLAFLCDAGGWLNLWCSGPDGSNPRPLLREQAEHGGPSWGPGQRSYAWSPDGRQIAFCRNEAGFGRLCLVDLATGRVAELDRGVYHSLSWSGGRVAGVRSGARTPNQIVVLDPAGAASDDADDGGGARRTIARGPVAGFEAAGLIEPESVTWEVEDVAGAGTTVHGHLYRTTTPADESHPPPLLVWLHGGPTSQSRVVFNPRISYFCHRGFNVLQVDYRGSTGWGRCYTQALRGEWGRLDVADTAAGMAAASDRGWGDAKRMVPIGGSAGGLTVLLLLALHPQLCAAGVDLYGVGDLFELEETTHRFEAHYPRSLVGELPLEAERFRERSPVAVAERITAPLLVLQGSADVVVSQSQSDRVVERVRAAGGTVEYHVYDGEGHGWSRPEVVEDELERIWAFLRRYVLRRH